MSTAYVLDEALKDHLLSLGGKLVEEKKTVNGKMIWTINYPDSLSFNFSSEEYKEKIIPCKKFVLRF